MQSEHLTNLHPGWIVGGWLIALAVTSAVYLALVGTGLLPQGPLAVVGVVLAVTAGFFVGGLFVGLRWGDAPILHGAAITFLSVLLWFVAGVAAQGSLDAWTGPTPAVLGIVLVQMTAASAGGWVGRRMMLGGDVAEPEG